MWEVFTWTCVALTLVLLPVSAVLQARHIAKSRHEGGELLYRERSPWRRFSTGRRVLIVAGTLFWLVWLASVIVWRDWNSLPILLIWLFNVLWLVDAWNGFPYSGLEFRSRLMLIGCRPIRWEQIREYCWLEPRANLRLKIEHWGYVKWRVNPADRAAIESILHDHQVPMRPPTWTQHAHSAA